MWALAQALRDLRARLEADPAPPRSVWEAPPWEAQFPVVRDPEGQSQYSPPTSLPRGAPAPHVPSARVVLWRPIASTKPPVAAVAATVPMPVFDVPPSPAHSGGSAGKPASAPRPPAVAAPTIPGHARTSSRRRLLWAPP